MQTNDDEEDYTDDNYNGCTHRTPIGESCTYCADDEYTGFNHLPAICGVILPDRMPCFRRFKHDGPHSHKPIVVFDEHPTLGPTITTNDGDECITELW